MMEEAIFNEHGVCTNFDIIKSFGNDKAYYNIKAAIFNGRVIAEYNRHTTKQGGSSPLMKISFDFKDKNEAISFHRKIAWKWAMDLPTKDGDIILKSIEKDRQQELF